MGPATVRQTRPLASRRLVRRLVRSTCDDPVGGLLVQPTQLQTRLRPHVPALVPGLTLVGLMLVWAVHDGGYDAETWYWGALAALGLLAATAIMLGGSLRLNRASAVAISVFGLYVAWSYLSITWAQSPGDALAGSNRALLYLLVFSLMLLLPWTPKAALLALLTFVIGIGVIGIVLLFRLASQSDVSSLVIEGRLSAPTGYFNATAALFTVGALPATVLATRRELPGPLRGLLLALACADLQLALIVQSRGWLFTLPLVLVAAIAVVPNRLRVAVAAIIPIVGSVVPLHRLFDVYQQSSGVALTHAAGRAGQAALLICLAAFVLGTLLAWGDSLIKPPSLSRSGKRAIGITVTVIAVAGAGSAFVVATHGHPVKFIVRQWNGFSHTQVTSSSQSHFEDVGGAAAARAHRFCRLCAVRRVPGRRRPARLPRETPARQSDQRGRGGRAAAPGRVADSRIGRLVLGDAGAQRPGARFSRDGGLVGLDPPPS
jgi:hypothetical protein